MSEPTVAPIPAPVLAVDLDGTLCRFDTLLYALRLLLQRQPWRGPQVFWWWLRHGRAYCKQEIAARIVLDAAALPWHQPLIAWLQERRANGTRLVMATGCDRRMAQALADHLGLFEAVLASDGHTNLTGPRKRAKLDAVYGAGQWGYVGNTWIDLKVWQSAAEIVVVSDSVPLRQQAEALGPVSRCFSAA